MTLFWMILAFNITGIIPPFMIAGTSVIGVPLVLALVSYCRVQLGGDQGARGRRSTSR